MTLTPRRIVDAHHHIWRRDDLAWLKGPMQPRIFGPYEAIRRDYPIAEYRADAAPHGVARSVYVQTNWPPGGEAAEVAWVTRVAAEHGFPHAIVGYADLAAPDLAATLDRLGASPLLRGIRQQLHWHANPAYRFAARPDLMNDEGWRRGFAELARRDLLFELQIFASQMADGARLARAFPQTRFVLLHAGMLEDRSPACWALWREGMARLAECGNVAVKLSGLGTFIHRCEAGLWAPVVAETLRLFGAGRCLFGSNFPIEKIWTQYGAIVAAVDAALTGLDERQRDAVFWGNAVRLYRLADEASPISAR